MVVRLFPRFSVPNISQNRPSMPIGTSVAKQINMVGPDYYVSTLVKTMVQKEFPVALDVMDTDTVIEAMIPGLSGSIEVDIVTDIEAVIT